MTSRVEYFTSGIREQVSTRLTFLIAGLGMAAWAPLVPYAKDRVGADSATLGLLLLCLGFGSIVAMPLTGVLASRYGCRAVVVASTIGIALAIPLLSVVDNSLHLALALAFFGASVGAVDVAANIQAIIVEKDSGRSMMSGFHGLFSLGGFIGAGGVSLALGSGTPLLTVATLTSLFLMVLLIGAYRGLLTYGDSGKEAPPAFAMPRGIVLLLGVLCFLVFMGEGAILDWSALFLLGEHGYEQTSAGAGYAAFAVTMTMGRLLGDRVVSCLGGRRIVLIGGILGAVGFALVVFAKHHLIVLGGFALVGTGLSNVVPVFFTAAGRQTAMPPGLAVAAITTMGYSGILLGPALIGFIAQIWSLSFGFFLLSTFLVFVTIVGPIAARER